MVVSANHLMIFSVVFIILAHSKRGCDTDEHHGKKCPTDTIF